MKTRSFPERMAEKSAQGMPTFATLPMTAAWARFRSSSGPLFNCQGSSGGAQSGPLFD